MKLYYIPSACSLSKKCVYVRSALNAGLGVISTEVREASYRHPTPRAR
jgi:hypothetical protein